MQDSYIIRNTFALLELMMGGRVELGDLLYDLLLKTRLDPKMMPCVRLDVRVVVRRYDLVLIQF